MPIITDEALRKALADYCEADERRAPGEDMPTIYVEVTDDLPVLHPQYVYTIPAAGVDRNRAPKRRRRLRLRRR